MKEILENSDVVKKNDEWNPDFSNFNCYKYYPGFSEMGFCNIIKFYFHKIMQLIRLDVGLKKNCYDSKELAAYAGKKLLELYKKD